jgi:hypothetical protein
MAMAAAAVATGRIMVAGLPSERDCCITSTLGFCSHQRAARRAAS